MLTRGSNLNGLLFCLAAGLVPLGYALFTNHIWEDYFITFRYSQNLCEGKGLVYEAGERVHGFTSPLGVLLPALCHYLSGAKSYVLSLWLFRGMSILAFVAGGLLVLRCVPANRPDAGLLRLVLGALYVLEVKAVAYTTNGMETGFMLLFASWAFYNCTRDRKYLWIATGISWAGLMWTRPDGCVYITALSLASLLLPIRGRRQTLVYLGKSALICTALYLPWFLWAWNYYGTPIPHTVVAKSNLEAGPVKHVATVIENLYWRFPQVAGEQFHHLTHVLERGKDKLSMFAFTPLVSLFCAFYWLLPVPDRMGRMASFCFFFLCLYFCFLTVLFWWYEPPVILFGFIVLASGSLTIARQFANRFPASRALALAFLLFLIGERSILFAFTTWQMKIHQTEIEFGNRMRIGLWLKERVKPNETVYLEPLGYIGYFSGARMVDWPGLVAPQLDQLRRLRHLDMNTVIPEIQPDWIVFRSSEVEELLASEAAEFFKANYRLLETFDATPRLNEYSYIPGEEYVRFDACFQVYKKGSSAGLLLRQNQLAGYNLRPVVEP